MPKTKDAFAFRAIADLLKIDNNFDEYERLEWVDRKSTLPIYNFEQYFDNGNFSKDDVAIRVMIIASRIVRQLSHTNYFYADGVVPADFYGFTIYSNECDDRINKLDTTLQNIDKHIARLHCYQEEILKQFLNTDEDFQNLKYKLARIKVLISLYSDIESNIIEIKSLANSEKKIIFTNLIRYFSKEFGERVRTARSEKKLRQADIAAALDIPLPTYSQYERGIREPPLFVIHRLTKILDKSADYFLATDT